MGWGTRISIRAAGIALLVLISTAAALVTAAAPASADSLPVVTSLSVSTGTPGTVVGVNGSGFLGGCAPGQQPQIALGPQIISSLVNASDAVVHFQVPVIRDGLYDVQVIDCNGNASPAVTADQFNLTLPPRPKLTSVTPKTAMAGATVTAVGTSLRLYCTDGRIPSLVIDDLNTAGDEVVVHDGDPQVVSWTDTKLVVRMPSHAAGLVEMLPVDCVGRSAAPAPSGEFTYLAPKVTTVSPTTGTAGTRVTVRGANFTGGCMGGSAPTLLIGGIELTAGSPGVVSIAATQIVVLSPPHAAGTVTVQVRNCVGDTSPLASTAKFTYLAPKISSLSPSSGRANTLVAINGAGFTNGCVPGSSAPVVQFGATTLFAGDARYISATAGVIKVRSPTAAPSKVDVRVFDCLGDVTAVVAADKFTNL